MNPERRTVLPLIAFNTYFSRLEPPSLEEGFLDITEHQFSFHGTEAEKKLWCQYWAD
jgi:bifunctional polynucleotide phosphatase/kinase